MKKVTLFLIGIIAVIMLVGTKAEARNPDNIFFGYRSAELSSEARDALEQMALDLKHLKQVLITSYVPDVGDVSENQLFANQRIETVKNFLIEQGVPASVISTQTLPGPASKQRMVELSYGVTAMPSPSSPPPPPTSMKAPPPAATPPLAKEPVITAKPERKYKSGVTEADISNQPYRGDEDTPPSRWEY